MCRTLIISKLCTKQREHLYYVINYTKMFHVALSTS